LEQARVLDVLVERKAIKDLVGRSFDKDHLKQIRKMRLAAETCPIQFLLLEGDPKSAFAFTYGGASRPCMH
jgi:ERCC4-type nuclease